LLRCLAALLQSGACSAVFPPLL